MPQAIRSALATSQGHHMTAVAAGSDGAEVADVHDAIDAREDALLDELALVLARYRLATRCPEARVGMALALDLVGRLMELDPFEDEHRAAARRHHALARDAGRAGVQSVEAVLTEPREEAA